MSGWRKSISGLAGFNISSNNNWRSNPNPNAISSALNLGLTALANKNTTKAFWNNKLIASKGWLDIDKRDGEEEDDKLFDNGNVDILNLSSLGGYKVNPKLAISALGELNTGITNFLAPGTLDIGAGVTWLPISNMTVVVHPLNYNYKFSGLDNVESTGGLGAKLRVDYARNFNILSKKFAWSSTLTSFLPYQNKTFVASLNDSPTDTWDATLFEYTWLNTISFEVWKGIGVGFNFGFRDASFEFKDLQSFNSIGLSWGF